MIKLIVGEKGTGKTKAMIDMINAVADTTNGNVVVVEKSIKLTYDISHKARLIDVDEYKITNYDALYGFLAGLLAGNYDITDVFVDGSLKIGGYDLEGYGVLLDQVRYTGWRKRKGYHYCFRKCRDSARKRKEIHGLIFKLV